MSGRRSNPVKTLISRDCHACLPEAVRHASNIPITYASLIKEYWPYSGVSIPGQGGDPSDTATVDCVKTEALLVSWPMPAANPASGTVLENFQFTSQTSVSAVDGIAANTALCQNGGGADVSTFGPNGYYMQVTMTKQ